MFKSLLAATAAITCCLGNPAMAYVGEAFDQATAPQQSAGNCYQTTGGHSVCWFRINGATYSIALREVNNRPDYATSIVVNCGGQWEAYGPGQKAGLQALVDAFCTEQGH